MKDEHKLIEKYRPTIIEPKWQEKWEKENLYKAIDFDKREKFYTLIEFPYPSGAGLHVGHARSWSAMDAYSRKKRMEGKNVLYPIGWDAFGLPAENYAIKMKVHPSQVVPKNIAVFKRQCKSLGLSFDWSREIDTTDPKYYKWTQWIFLKFFEKGLTYQADVPVNWCSKCKTNLADEEVLADGTHERCGCKTEKRMQKQWLLKITSYAQRLLDDLKSVDYSNRIKVQQENWIGRSEGAEIKFKIQGNHKEDIVIYTVFPETIFGVTYMVLAPEHSLVEKLTTKEQKDAVGEYLSQTKKKSEIERTAEGKEKTGVFTGSYCINPVNGKEAPVWVADYVIGSYGTGAVMGVPGSDHRDFAFAKKYNLPIIRVIGESKNETIPIKSEKDVLEEGFLVNSEQFSGLETPSVAREKIKDYLEEQRFGKRTVQYHLRDWVFSRQHYWGEPIPIVYCEECKNKKYKYLLLHGRHGSSHEDFFPWLKKELESLGHQVYAPDLPDTENPKVEEQADFVIKNFKIDSNTIIVGHSLGGAVALNILEKTNKKVVKVLFVDSLICPKFTDKRRPDIEKNFHWKFDFEKIKKLSEEFVDLADQDFPIIPKEQFEDKNKLLNTRLLYVKPNANHFNSAIEPLVLEYARNNGVCPVPEKDLPVELPYLDKYEPSGTGESPLANAKDWVNTVCPICGGPARRETDTMPNWAGSNWYYLAYLFANKLGNQKSKIKNQKYENDNLFKENKSLMDYWMPIDIYQGGFEHTTLHLLYSRFVYKFLFDIGVVPSPEPYAKRRSHGIVLGPDGKKMSKSFGNVIDPDDIVGKFGADTLRVYEMFMGPFDQTIAWSEEGVEGCYRFLKRVWQLSLTKGFSNQTSQALMVSLNKTIKKVGEDLESLKFNTAVASMMEFINGWQNDKEGLNRDELKKFLLILSPFAPHIAEELWERDLNASPLTLDAWSIHQQSWPVYDPKLLKEDEITIVVQVNGKIRDTVKVQSANITYSVNKNQNYIEEKAKESAKVKKYLEGKSVKRVVFIENKIINFVVV